MTSRPASASARAAASPITPAPTTTASTSSTDFSFRNPSSRRKPGPTYPLWEWLKSGSRPSPGRHFGLSLHREKVAEGLVGGVRRFLRDKMAALDAVAADVRG